jgi:protein-ribulosamine 3-kinase
MKQIPGPICERLQFQLAKEFGNGFSLNSFSFSSGGCVSNGGKLQTSDGDFFLKWNDAKKFPGMFKAESRGLQLLKETKSFYIPKVMLVDEADGLQYLLMSFTQEGKKTNIFWEELGRGLAHLHQRSNSQFGLDHDNYIGSLRQRNTQCDSWITFFESERIRPQMKLAEDSQLMNDSLKKEMEQLLTRLPDLLAEDKPSLLHGDLWSGNLMTTSNGRPSLIDPAVYFGHREVDLAMTKLFGGFKERFYESYQEAFPLEPGYEQRMEIYNLYPLLVHVNLFGGAYLMQLRQTVLRYA